MSSSSQFTANGNIFIGTEPRTNPQPQQAAWKDGVAALLTADENKRLQAARDARKVKRVHVMGEVMLMTLDEKIAFTAAQRQQLQPIVERLVKDIPELYPDNSVNANFNGSSTDMFYSAAAKATEAELKPILDDIQWKHWQHLSDAGRNAPADRPDGDKSKPERSRGTGRRRKGHLEFSL